MMLRPSVTESDEVGAFPVVRQTGAGDEPGVVAENDENEERAEKQKVFSGLFFSENTGKIVVEVFNARLDHILEFAGPLAAYGAWRAARSR